MYTTARGVVIKETHYNEADKILTVFTHELGKISVFAKGVKKLKSKLMAGCQLFSYSEFMLFETKSMYGIAQCERIDVFPELRQDLEELCFAAYFCDLLASFFEEGEEGNEALRLLLNTFHALSRTNHPKWLIKAAFELRLTSLAGYVPNMQCCHVCKEAAKDDAVYFALSGGNIFCEACGAAAAGGGDVVQITPGIRSCIYYITQSDLKKIFSFATTLEGIQTLNSISERYILHHVDKHLHSLDYLKKMVTF